jgi:hypothetical protein
LAHCRNISSAVAATQKIDATRCAACAHVALTIFLLTFVSLDGESGGKGECAGESSRPRAFLRLLPEP